MTLDPADDVTPRPALGDLFRDLRLTPDQLQELEDAGIDLNKLRRFLRDGIGDLRQLHVVRNRAVAVEEKRPHRSPLPG
mgnify:CR=1 FL=1